MMRVKSLLSVLLLQCFLGYQVWAETRYVSDILSIQMRSGPGNEYRIIKTLRTGTQMTTIGEADNNGYIEVVLTDGTQGFVRQQYLMDERSAREQLSAVQLELESLKANASPTHQKLMDLQQSNRDLDAQLQQTQAQLLEVQTELQKIMSVSANAVAIAEQNDQLRLANSRLENELAIAESEITRLNASNDKQFMIYGALAVLMGVIITLIVPALSPRKKSSEWR